MLAALAALALAATEARFESSVSAGGGYESNLNHADRSGLQEGAGFLALRAAGGVALDVGERTALYAGARLDGDHYPALADLSTGTVGVEASLLRELGERWAVVLSPHAFSSWAGDETRNLTGWGGQLAVRVRPVPRLALRASWGYTETSAEDPVFSSDRHRLGASVEVRAAERVYLSVGWSGERGDEVYYRPPTAPTVLSRMRGGPVSTFGEALEAYRAEADAHAVGPAVEIGLGEAAWLRASYVHRWVSGDAGDFRTSTVFAGLGVRR